MRKQNKKSFFNKNRILLTLAILICISAAGATWAILKSVATPVVNRFSEAVKYELSYDLNGGTGVIDAETYVDDGTKESYKFTVTDKEPILEEYKFLGWADTADADTAVYSTGTEITLTKESPKKTVYAVWEAVVPEERSNFRLEFNGNVPEGVAASVAVPSAVEKNAGGDLYTFNISNALAKDYNVDNTGMRFMGWSTSEFGDVIYACDEEKPSISVTAAPGTTTLYAVWGFDYYITYSRNVNDGSVIKYQKDNSSYQDDQTEITVKVDYNTVSVSGLYTDSGYSYRRPEHMLVGFATDANGTQPLQSVVIPKAGKNNALTVYAIWKDGSFALVYDANGGKSAPNADIQITNATSYTFTVTSEKPVKADNAEATFLGWAANPDATEVNPAYAAGQKITLTEDSPTMTLYAVWEYTYRLSFKAGNATDNPDNLPLEIVVGPTTDKFVTITVPSNPIPVRDQYEFDYWAASEKRVSGEHRYNDVANYSRTITLHADDTSVTMYARMKPTNGVTFYLSDNNGNNTWYQQTTNDNTQDFCTFTIPSNQPSRSNYTFLGWAEDKDAIEPTLFAGDVVKIDGDVQPSKTIYAVWKSYDRMRVFIDFNGGSYDVTTGSGCNETTTTYRNRSGSYEYIAPGETVHNFGMVTFDKYWDGWTQKLRFPTRTGYSVAGFAYVNDEGRLSTAISMKDSSLCDEGGVKGFSWNAQSAASGAQTVILDKENPDGSKDYTLRTYIIWAQNEAYDKYVVNLDQNHNNSTSNNIEKTQFVKQVEEEASGDKPAVINTSYTFGTSSFSLGSLANSRTGYKLLGFARTRDATSTEWAVSGTNLQKSITVSQDDSDVVFEKGTGRDGGSTYTLNLYAIWQREQLYKLHADFGIGSYSVSSTRYDDYTWKIQQPLSQKEYTWTSPSMGGTPSKSGYKFLGFSTDPNATTAEYTVSNNTLSPSITVSQDDPRVVKTTSSDNVDTWTLNLYAVYEKQRLFELIVDFNGGTYNTSSASYTSDSIRHQRAADEPIYNMSASGLNYPSRYGYKLLGLATSPDATEPEYSFSTGGIVSPAVVYDTSILTPAINSDGVEVYSQTLYAVWEEQREFTVKVDANGGTYASDAVRSVTQRKDMDVTEVTWNAGTLSIATPTKTDFRFLGYAYTKDATVPDFTISSGKIVETLTVSENGAYVVNNTSSIPNTSTLTLYAVWEPVKYYQLRFDLGEGSYTDSSGNTLHEILIKSGVQLIDSEKYNFVNPYYTARYGVSRLGYSLSGYTDIKNATELLVNQPTSSGSSSPYTYTFKDTNIEVAEGAAGITVERMENGVMYVTKTLYPIWQTSLNYSRSYYHDVTGLPDSVIRYNEDADNRIFDISETVPKYKSFQFAGWTTSTSSMIPEYGVSGYVSNSTEPLATQYTLSKSSSSAYLYSVWWQKYSISYSANGGMENTTPGRESAYVTLNYDDTTTKHTFEIGNNIPLYDENNSREFLGWSTDPNVITNLYQPGKDVEIIGNTDGSETQVILYAIWGSGTSAQDEGDEVATTSYRLTNSNISSDIVADDIPSEDGSNTDTPKPDEPDVPDTPEPDEPEPPKPDVPDTPEPDVPDSPEPQEGGDTE